MRRWNAERVLDFVDRNLGKIWLTAITISGLISLSVLVLLGWAVITLVRHFT